MTAAGELRVWAREALVHQTYAETGAEARGDRRLRAFALNCTLKASPEPSSTDVLLDEVEKNSHELDVKMARARVADHACGQA